METKQKLPWFLTGDTPRHKDINFSDGYKYDYVLQILLDIHDYCKDNDFNILGLYSNCYSQDQIEEKLYYDCFDDDSVNGNSSGSYWFSQWYAECALCHNYDLLVSALDEFGELGSLNLSETFPEALDVKIRIYLLGDCVHEYVNEIFFCYVEN